MYMFLLYFIKILYLKHNTGEKNGALDIRIDFNYICVPKSKYFHIEGQKFT